MDKSNIKKIKEFIKSLEKLNLSKDVKDKIIHLFLLSLESKSQRSILLHNKLDSSPEEILYKSFARLDKEIERTEELKIRVDAINYELQKIPY